MELLLSRSQKTGMGGLGGVTFVLNVRSRLTDEESDYVRKYKLGKGILYEKDSVAEKLASSGALKQVATFVGAKMKGHVFSVDDLVNGRAVECKDIVEMMAAEEQIKEAAENFHNILTTCKHFGGEEVITFPREG